MRSKSERKGDIPSCRICLEKMRVSLSSHHGVPSQLPVLVVDIFFARAENKKVTTQLLVLIKTGCTASWVVIFLLPARSEISQTQTQFSMFCGCSYHDEQ